MFNPDEVTQLNQRFNAQPTEEILHWAWERFGARAAIGTSFQGAGLVMMDLAVKHRLPFPVFTLDTGFLFDETIALKTKLERHFGLSIEAVVPDLTPAQQEDAHGPELWARDPDMCCGMRKVLPLQGKLGDLDCWITGLRRQQSETRTSIGIIELYNFDGEREIVKLNPMANWTKEAVWNHLRENGIPYNPLHDQGYRSIGCRPCTTKAAAGENERAGRWTGFNKVECGIHTFMARKA